MTSSVNPKRFATALAVIVTIAIAPAAMPAYAGLASGAISPWQVQKIVAAIQVMRGLKFKTKVPINYLTPDAAAARMKADIERDRSKESIRLDTESGVMLGLYPPNVDLTAATIGMLKQQLGGFYDFRKKDLAVVESLPAKGIAISKEEKIEGVYVIAHELTHALQAQNFNIAKTLDNGGQDDDRSLAYRAVVEGDATLAGFCLLAGRADDQVLDTFIKNIPGMEKQFAEKSKDVPFGVREPFIFQYMQGARFVAEAFHRNGWAGVNALYAKPPQSTQQVLNPWMYFDRPTPVPQVHLAGYEKVLSDWKKSDESTAGELMLRVVIQAALGKHSSYVVLANVWAGDRMITLTKGTAVTVLWMIAFTNDDSAQTFTSAYGEALDKIDGAHTAHRIERNGSTVLVMVGAGATRSQDYLAEVWKQSGVSPSPRPPG